jgi:hypothetical protein
MPPQPCAGHAGRDSAVEDPAEEEQVDAVSDRLPCPHCGEMFTDLWDYPWESQEIVITECGECLGPVDIVRHVSVRYELLRGEPASAKDTLDG